MTSSEKPLSTLGPHRSLGTVPPDPGPCLWGPCPRLQTSHPPTSWSLTKMPQRPDLAYQTQLCWWLGPLVSSSHQEPSHWEVPVKSGRNGLGEGRVCAASRACFCHSCCPVGGRTSAPSGGTPPGRSCAAHCLAASSRTGLVRSAAPLTLVTFCLLSTFWPRFHSEGRVSRPPSPPLGSA